MSISSPKKINSVFFCLAKTFAGDDKAAVGPANPRRPRRRGGGGGAEEDVSCPCALLAAAPLRRFDPRCALSALLPNRWRPFHLRVRIRHGVRREGYDDDELRRQLGFRSFFWIFIFTCGCATRTKKPWFHKHPHAKNPILACGCTTRTEKPWFFRYFRADGHYLRT